jgi:hypothetical protein
MKNYLMKVALIAGFAILSVTLHGQPWMANITDKNNPNFFEVQKAFNDYWNSKGFDNSKRKGTEGEDEDLAGWYQFKRWEWFMAPRVSPTGELPDPMIAYNENKKFQSQSNDRMKHIANITSNWTCLGPTSVPAANSGQHGAGRINCMTVNPHNANTIYVGSPAGGFWKSYNGGTSWITTTDHNATLGVSDIVVNPNDTNIVYIATGDTDANDTYSAGVLKSYDGGMTWTTTGLNWQLSQSRTISRILIKPDSTNVMIAATSSGIMRSIDSGSTWSTVLNVVSMCGVELKPGDSKVVYACSHDHYYRSTNGGLSFSYISSGLPTTGVERMAIAVTANDTNYVYALMSATDYSFGGLYRSSDGGTTFSSMSTTPNILGTATDGSSTGGQGWYDLALAVSPTSANTVMVGGINVWKSTNGGSTWSCVGKGYNNVTSSSHVHPDIHNLAFAPGNGSVVYCCCDGGLFKSSNTGTAWADMSSGLQIMEFYSISSSQTSSTICFGGSQDNGGNKYSSGTWTNSAAGDAMHVIIDFTTANDIYDALPNGDILFSNDGGTNWGDITPNGNANGSWVTPYVLDPNNHNTVYAGYSDVFKSTNQGGNWTQISTNLTGGSNLIQAMAVAPSNSNYIYVAAGPQSVTVSECNTLYKTTNGGTSWSNITAGLPLGNAPLTYIAVKNTDANTLWVTLSNYYATDKVFKSTNAGATWTNVTGNLPNVPVNCIVYVPNTPNGIYVGTDLGVFYTDDILGTWVPFSTNLPNVIVNELDIQASSGKLRAGTYGRGLWETPIYITTNVSTTEAIDNSIKVYPNPTTGEVYIDFPANSTTDISVYNIIGDKIDDIAIETSGMNQSKIDLSNQPKGIYLIRIQNGETVSTEKVVLMK